MPHMHRIVYDMYQEIVAEMNARQQVNPVCEGPRSANDLEILAFSPLFGPRVWLRLGAEGGG